MVKCESCKRYFKNLKGLHIHEYHKHKGISNIKNDNSAIEFLKCEIRMIKSQLKLLKTNGLQIVDNIERIKPDNHRPERNIQKVQFRYVVKELKNLFGNSDNFNYRNILYRTPTTPEIYI